MDNHSHIDYTEYHDESEEPSLYLSVSDTQDKQSFKSIDLSEKHHFKDSWKFAQPKRKSYYDTDKISDSIDDTSKFLLDDNKIKTIPGMLTNNINYYEYTIHIIGIVLLIVFIVFLIIILTKT